MKQAYFNKIIICMLLYSCTAHGQKNIWTYNDCMGYALSNNLDIKRAELQASQQELNFQQSKWNRLPTVAASASQQSSWSKNNNTDGSSAYSQNSTTNAGIQASAVIYQGFKQQKQINKAGLKLKAQSLYSEQVAESIRITILTAYIEILYRSDEETKAAKQLKASAEQLKLAEQRMARGIISKSDYLQVKSELASKKLHFVSAQSDLKIAEIEMMNLLEIPVQDSFIVTSLYGNADTILQMQFNPDSIYYKAVSTKPQLKYAEVSKEAVMMDEKIAKSDYSPTLSMNTGANIGWTNSTSAAYLSQSEHYPSPYIGFSLSVPIFQKRQVQTNVKSAKIAYKEAELETTDIRNQLRAEIEQLCAESESAKATYQASKEQLEASSESYRVAKQKFEMGMMNTADLLLIENTMIDAESDFLQAKYRLIYKAEMKTIYCGEYLK